MISKTVAAQILYARPFFVVVALSIALLCIAPTANATVFVYTADMDGPSESPPNASPGTGFARVDYDDVAHTMRVQANFTGLTGTTTQAHIHAPTPAPATLTAGVATQLPSFSGFPLGVTSGSMDTTFDLTMSSSWNPSYISANGGTPAGAEAAFKMHLDQVRAYFNIHTTTFGGGEIRGFLRLIPEPASILLLLCGLMPVALARRGRK